MAWVGVVIIACQGICHMIALYTADLDRVQYLHLSSLHTQIFLLFLLLLFFYLNIEIKNCIF